MRRYEPSTVSNDLETIVPILARLYARIVQESARDRVVLNAPQVTTDATPERRLLLRMGDVAEALSISRTKVYALIQGGELPVVRIGRSVRVSTGALHEWISRRSAPL